MGNRRLMGWCVGSLLLVGVVGCASTPEAPEVVTVVEETKREAVTVAQLDGVWWAREADDLDFEGYFRISNGRFQAFEFGQDEQQGSPELDMTVVSQDGSLLTFSAGDGDQQLTVHAQIMSRDRMLMWANGEDEAIFAYRVGGPVPDALVGVWSACVSGFDEFFSMEFTADALIEPDGGRHRVSVLDASGPSVLLGMVQEEGAEAFTVTPLPDEAWMVVGNEGYFLLHKEGQRPEWLSCSRK